MKFKRLVVVILYAFAMALAITGCSSSSNVSSSDTQDSIDEVTSDVSASETSGNSTSAEYAEISWSVLCESVYSIEITANNCQDYVSVVIKDNGYYTFVIKNPGTYYSAEVLIAGTTTHCITYHNGTVQEEVGNFSDNISSIGSSDYTASASYALATTTDMESCELVSVSYTSASGSVIVMNVADKYWNTDTDGNFLYAKTPDGYYVKLYSDSRYDVIIDASETKTVIGDNWRSYISASTYVTSDYMLATK